VYDRRIEPVRQALLSRLLLHHCSAALISAASATSFCVRLHRYCQSTKARQRVYKVTSPSDGLRAHDYIVIVEGLRYTLNFADILRLLS
jgi:hypothetical protein